MATTTTPVASAVWWVFPFSMQAKQSIVVDPKSPGGVVDRLTRSLADFAKLVELFDKHNVSFVSVTQQFNTTTSMGRLTLNVLLSVCPIRTRGHLRAHPGQDLSGYDTNGRRITVNETEADRERPHF